MRQIMEKFGDPKNNRIKFDRYGFQQQRAVICISNEKEVVIAATKKKQKKIKDGMEKNTKKMTPNKFHPENSNNKCNFKEHKKHKSHEKHI